MLGLRSKAQRVTSRSIISAALIQANASDAWDRLRGINTHRHRLGDPAWERDREVAPATEDLNNICVFVIYGSGVSRSTLSYLQALANAGLSIIAINNTNTSNEFMASLKPICWKIYNRRNIGRDIGAYKDALMMLYEEGVLQQCRFLCMANDSMQFVPGRNGDDFSERIAEFINEGTGALFSHVSHQVTKHYQSYFQVVDRDIIRSHRFHDFWAEYRPLSHREHCIRKGELRLSESVYNHIDKAKVLYTTDALLAALRKAGPHPSITLDQILGIMPSIARTKQNKKSIYALDQLSAAALERKPIDDMSEHYLSELIEYSNPSHVAAFLYSFYLMCPLIKKDICLAGSFSTGKALLLFNEILCQSDIDPTEREVHYQEFRNMINMKGIPSDYRTKPIERALKGVTAGFQYTVT
jgi:hypothetical protein